ncbi:MAG: ATP-binding protein, partial [Candidatus Thorarchaeota archaeon]|nr:ATP-binding protein [Candidatus Thorarchaeota archaeon]
IKADRFLETLLINLIENAVQHNPLDNKQVWIQIQRESTGFEISISDNGPGIDTQRKKELFDKSRRYGGVGLHVATQIVRKYGGILRVFDRVPSDHTQGADFRLWIPEPIVRWG